MTHHLAKIALTDMQAELRDQAQRYCAERSSIAKVRELLTDERGYDPDVWAEIAALGWLGIAIPEDHGGLGLDIADVVPVVEAMGHALMASPYVSTTLAAQAILAGGSDAQKAEWLPRIADGTAATVALFEPDGSWDLANTDGRTKVFVQDLHTADIVVVSVRVDEVTRLAILPRVRIVGARRETIIDETKRCFTFSVPDITQADLMPLDGTASALDRIALTAGLLQAAEYSGAAAACVDYTVDYLQNRTQFGKPIGAFQALKHPTVDAFIESEKARSLLYAAATHFERQGEGEIAVRMANVQGEKALSFAADRSIQFHGGFGFTYDCDAQLYRRRAMFLASQYGDAAYNRARLAELLL